jgi:hypothetical protein
MTNAQATHATELLANPRKGSSMFRIIILTAAILAAVVPASSAHGSDPLAPDRVCFDRADWGPAPDSARPCVVVTSYRPVCVVVSDANGRDSAGACLRISSVGSDYSVRVSRLYEDGSVCLAIARATRTVHRCIGNPRD